MLPNLNLRSMHPDQPFPVFFILRRATDMADVVA